MSTPMDVQFAEPQSSSSGSSSASPCEVIDGIPVDWSGRGTSHVDYDKTDELPLTRGRFLGHGVNGGVYETTCKGVKLAWKQKFSRRKIGDRERREIEIIKKLSYHHIIRIIGTYSQDDFLGLLLWPVAVCDLSTLLEDFDWLQETNKQLKDMDSEFELLEDKIEETEDLSSRLNALGLRDGFDKDALNFTRLYLEQAIGCIASAVVYLHESNILAVHEGILITYFGTATDFSILSSSATENGERGTPKYFAPEVAAYAPSGRSADIFSMGCIFFEIITICNGNSSAEIQQLRKRNDKSFHENIDYIRDWLKSDKAVTDHVSGDYILDLVLNMIETNPEKRPTAASVETAVLLISGLAAVPTANVASHGAKYLCRCRERYPVREFGFEYSRIVKEAYFASDNLTVEIS